MEPPGRCGDWLAPPPSPPRAHAPGRHDEREMGTFIWPPAGTYTWPSAGTFPWPWTPFPPLVSMTQSDDTTPDKRHSRLCRGGISHRSPSHRPGQLNSLRARALVRQLRPRRPTAAGAAHPPAEHSVGFSWFLTALPNATAASYAAPPPRRPDPRPGAGDAVCNAVCPAPSPPAPRCHSQPAQRRTGMLQRCAALTAMGDLVDPGSARHVCGTRPFIRLYCRADLLGLMFSLSSC